MGISTSLLVDFRKKGFLIYVCIIISCNLTFTQNQSIADSLEIIYKQGNYTPNDKLGLLKSLTENQLEVERKIFYSRELIKTAKALDTLDYVYSGYLQIGNAFRMKGDLSQSLENYFKAAKIAEDKNIQREVGIVNVAIADVYSIMGNHKRSLSYYRNAIQILKPVNDSASLGTAFSNIGDEFLNYKELDSALFYFEKAGEIFKDLNHESGVAYSIGNLGLVYALLGENERAEKNIYQAVEMLEKTGDFYPVCVFLTYMSDIYLEKGEDTVAMNFAIQSLELARTYELKDQISLANLKISELEEKAGNIPASFRYYKDYVTYRDSVRNVTAIQEMATLRADYEVLKRQTEIDLLNEQRKNQKLVVISVSTASVLIALLAFGLFRRNRFIKRTSLIIEKEKNRSDSLLLNILPEETAKELKEYGRVEAKKFDSVSVLFADFKDFTRYAEKLAPERLIKTIDYYFSCFDKIMEKYGIEKIKTLGDSYMAAAGLPFATRDHATKMLFAALEIAEIVQKTKKNTEMPEANFEVRIGIHSGPIVAGVVGTKKFAYDIWGDTVNIASRMETASAAGKINISEYTYELVKHEFTCEYRGEIEVRNRGILKMYFVNGLKEDLKNTVTV